MGMCLADSLLATRSPQGAFHLDPIDLLLRFEAWWLAGYNNAFRKDNSRRSCGSVGLGGTVSASLGAFLRHGHAATRSGDSETSGSGSIMRAAAVALAFHSDEAAAVCAARSAKARGALLARLLRRAMPLRCGAGESRGGAVRWRLRRPRLALGAGGARAQPHARPRNAWLLWELRNGRPVRGAALRVCHGQLCGGGGEGC
jgi:hypothetical protein